TVTTYLYLSQTAVDTSISDPTSGTDGIFVELNISGAVYDSSVTTSLNSVEKGDERLKFYYTISAIQNNFRDIAIFDISSYNSSFGLAGVNEILSIDDDVTPEASGSFEAKNLTNNRTYNISFAVRDYYGFYTPLSSPLSATPLDIAEFLEKNQCYFISAGFMEQHYVLDYFRYIRDHYLLKVKLGQSFVDFYYKTAPLYVPYIMEHPLLQALIRAVAYTIYFIFNFGLYALCLTLLVIFLTSKVSKSAIRE
ncbi:CFI-box-CTERM domain-containing protein, partial [Halobacteriovorax sp.]|uniref:CFI-box-CTERM domain-containing protein n=1 Tax=Halobacteriovorax sp. TaxID=2020862 RepID=UPI00356AD609